MSSLRVPGYDVVELLGYGATGEVWLASESATGEQVALKRLRVPDDRARDRLRQEAAVLSAVAHPHVVRMRGLVEAGDDLVLVLDHAAGGSLAGLLSVRRRLDPGEVVTVAVALAQALAAVHAQGVVHGDVTPANVLFGADGRPMLSDLGVARLIGLPVGEAEGTSVYADPAALAGATLKPASDVYGLAAVCHRALTGRPPGPVGAASTRTGPGAVPELTRLGVPADLAAVVGRALDSDPAARPTAAGLALAVFDVHPAAPVGLVPRPTFLSHPAPEPVTHRLRPLPPQPATRSAAGRAPVRRRHRRPLSAPVTPLAGRARHRRLPAGPLKVLGALLSVVLVVAVAGMLGALWAGQTSPEEGVDVRGASTGPHDRSPGRGWSAVVGALDRSRATAFAHADLHALVGVYSPDAPALRRDRLVIRRLADAGLRTRGLRLDHSSVRLLESGSGRVVLRVVDALPAYDLVDARGRLVTTRRGRAEQAWRMTLQRVDGEWRVYDVVRG